MKRMTKICCARMGYHVLYNLAGWEFSFLPTENDKSSHRETPSQLKTDWIFHVHVEETASSLLMHRSVVHTIT